MVNEGRFSVILFLSKNQSIGMLKREIRGFFKAIRSRNLEHVVAMVNRKPELINSCYPAPPVKDNGQSPLQVAFKIGEFDIASFLIKNEADVEFKEESAINEWTAPVLHD